MDYTILVSLSGLVVTGIGWGVTYGKLHGQVVAQAKRIDDLRQNIEDRMTQNKEQQDERDRRQDARTKDIEGELRSHTSDLSEVKVWLKGLSKDMEHVVKAVDTLVKASK